MTTIPVKRNLIDALIGEPIALAISQPHQALISSASVYLVAAEAGLLIGSPANWLMAIGAEWAYLKGLTSGQAVKTPWAGRLNWAAVLLVILYGSLWGMRRFGVPLPQEGFQATDVWSIAGAVVLTAIHIFSIGAVTLCSAMVHRAAIDAEHAQRAEQEAREQERQNRLQAERDAMRLEAERKEQDLAYWEKAQRVKAALKQSSTPRAAQDRPLCPSCGQQLDSQDFALFKSAQARQARFRGCKTCRAA